MSQGLNLRGYATVYVLSATIVVVIILTGLIQYVSSAVRYSTRQVVREESLQIAESGMYWYKWYLSHQLAGKTAQQIQQFWAAECGGGATKTYDEAEYLDPYGGAIGRWQVDIDCPPAYSTIITVRSSGWTYRGGSPKRRVQARFRRPSWSEYAVLANVESSYIRFGDGTDVSGPIHANGGVHFDGVAHNIVSSSTNTYYDSDDGIHAWKPGVWTAWSGEYNTNMGSGVFLSGKDFPVVPPKDFSGVAADMGVMKQAAIDSGTYFDDSYQGRRIILRDDDTFDVCTVRLYNTVTKQITLYDRTSGWGGCSACAGLCLQTFSLPDNGVIFTEDNVWLEGTVDGRRVTVVAADTSPSRVRDMYLGYGDVRYTNYDGSDIIGIVGEGNVSVIGPSADVLRVDGALLAQTGRVGRDYYDGANCSWPCQVHRNTITTFGAMATNQRYGFAYVNGTGYHTRNLLFDNNLLYFPPPYFPVGNDYFIDLWEEL